MKIFLLAIVSFCCLLLWSEDKPVEIQGLLGYRLGDDVSNIKGQSVDPRRMEVLAKIPFRNFTKCELSFTNEKKVYYISGEFTYPSKIEAEKEFLTILGMLEKKYNTKFNQENFLVSNGSPAQCYKYRQGDKILFLTLYESGLLSLNCVDGKTNVIENEKFIRENQQKYNNNPDAI